MTLSAEPTRIGAAALAILGCQAAAGSGALLVGPGAPPVLAEGSGQDPLSEEALILAAKDAQRAEEPPMMARGGDAAATVLAVLDEAEIRRALILIGGT